MTYPSLYAPVLIVFQKYWPNWLCVWYPLEESTSFVQSDNTISSYTFNKEIWINRNDWYKRDMEFVTHGVGGDVTRNSSSATC